MVMINYKLLDTSQKYYSNNGDFKVIEAPWTVTKMVSDITKPEDASHWTIKEKNKVLVASGEQSFLYLYLKGFLPKGRYQTITPCFRDDSFDFIHTKYFMKNELIDTEDTSFKNLIDIIGIAKRFFQQYFVGDLKVEQTDENAFDLMWMQYEIGSYGIRECEYLKWIYGTGLAEPRFSSLVRYNWQYNDVKDMEI